MLQRTLDTLQCSLILSLFTKYITKSFLIKNQIILSYITQSDWDITQILLPCIFYKGMIKHDVCTKPLEKEMAFLP